MLDEATKTKKVFIVHGHDEEMKQATARVLADLKLTPIILHEQPNQGRTIIEKFEKPADVGFAVVLLSPDDVAYSKEADPRTAKPRARQNVVLELGYFTAKLGRDRVFPLYRKGSDLQLPSDIAGVIYNVYETGGDWRFRLVQELKMCGYDVDAHVVL
jgi:predicted nucleotide-binding protein